MSERNPTYLTRFDPSKSGAPIVPDRAEEVVFFSLAALGLAAAIAGALYVWIALELPEASWSFSPVGIFIGVFVWRALKARKARLAASKELERFHAGVRKAASEI